MNDEVDVTYRGCQGLQQKYVGAVSTTKSFARTMYIWLYLHLHKYIDPRVRTNFTYAHPVHPSELGEMQHVCKTFLVIQLQNWHNKQ